MNLVVYPLLCLKSQRAIKKRKKKWGKPFIYQPRQQLLSRLARETGMTETEVRQQLLAEREFIARYPQYY